MSTYSIESDGRLLWCLRRRASDIRCVLYVHVVPVEIHVFQDRDIVLRELFPEEWLAINWARAYGDRLKQQGWHEVPASPDAGGEAGFSRRR